MRPAEGRSPSNWPTRPSLQKVDRASTIFNANTGDADSSGLNVVDATGSIVRSRNHSDDWVGGNDEEAPEEVDVNQVAPSTTSASDDGDQDQATANPASELVSRRDAGVGTSLVNSARAPLASASVSDDDPTTSATKSEVLLICGDDYDNLGVTRCAVSGTSQPTTTRTS